jgi:phosphatidylserine decarboxylase
VTLDREAAPFLVVLALVGIAAGVLLPVLLLLIVPATAFTLWFFRDPDRVAPADPSAVVSPADGRIIRSSPDGISVFLNVFDVHVCRSPVRGKVVSVEHVPGTFVAAFRDSASEQNERAEIVVEGEEGRTKLVLVAGLIARRIVCRVHPGQALRAGERVGMIRFGSRVDVSLPGGVAPVVKVGDRVSAGETVLARFAGPGRSSV